VSKILFLIELYRPQATVENLWKMVNCFGKLSGARFFHFRPQVGNKPTCGKVENYFQVLQT